MPSLTGANSAGMARVLITVHGRVQGVGFRPFVYRLATELGIDGEVSNTGGHVLITAAGPAAVLAKFTTLLTERAPLHARIDRVTVTEEPAAVTRAGFVVADSQAGAAVDAGTPADLATCATCVRELFDPADRRYRYPFITCTDCGPRATIIDALRSEEHT